MQVEDCIDTSTVLGVRRFGWVALSMPAYASSLLTNEQLNQIGVPTSPDQFEAPDGWRVSSVSVQGRMGHAAGPLVACLTEVSLWSHAQEGYATRRQLSLRRPADTGWKTVHAEELEAFAASVRLDLCNMDEDPELEVVLRHLSGGRSGEDRVDVRDLALGEWRRVLLSEGDGHELVDLDGDGALEVLAAHSVPTETRASCSAAGVTAPRVYSFRNQGFARCRSGFSPFYATRRSIAQDQLLKAWALAPGRHRSNQVEAYTKLVEELDRHLRASSGRSAR